MVKSFVRPAYFIMWITSFLFSLFGQSTANAQNIPNTAACRDYLAYARGAGAMSTYVPLMQKYNACVSSGGGNSRPAQSPNHVSSLENLMADLRREEERDRANAENELAKAERELEKLEAESAGDDSSSSSDKKFDLWSDAQHEKEVLTEDVARTSPFGRVEASAAEREETGSPAAEALFSSNSTSTTVANANANDGDVSKKEMPIARHTETAPIDPKCLQASSPPSGNTFAQPPAYCPNLSFVQSWARGLPQPRNGDARTGTSANETSRFVSAYSSINDTVQNERTDPYSKDFGYFGKLYDTSSDQKPLRSIDGSEYLTPDGQWKYICSNCKSGAEKVNLRERALGFVSGWGNDFMSRAPVR